MTFNRFFKRSFKREIDVLNKITNLVLAASIGLAFFAFGGEANAQQVEKKNTVIAMGMIHSKHRQSDVYGLDRLKELIREVKPDYVLTEIPPDRLEEAAKQYRESGTITESRVRVFPEYTDALFPLTKEMDFEIIPCAAWNKPMNDSRRATLAKARETHAKETAEMNEAQKQAAANIAKMGDPNDPAVIHTDQYDAYVKEGMGPYNRHFNDMIGEGGWENINAGHYALIEKALNEHKGEGKRFLITFGSWHKYYIKEQLRKRDDVDLVSMTEFLEGSSTMTKMPNQEEGDPEALLAGFAEKWEDAKWEKEFRNRTYMRATGDEGWKSRMQIMQQLVAGGKNSIAALEKHLTNEDTETRILAAQTISYLAQHASLEKLIEVAKTDADSCVRLYAVDAIGMSGKGLEVDWKDLAKGQRNRDVLKHINYARERKDQAVPDSTVSQLADWDLNRMDSAKVGELAPDFNLNTVDGQEMKLSDFRGKSPVVLVFVYGDT